MIPIVALVGTVRVRGRRHIVLTVGRMGSRLKRDWCLICKERGCWGLGVGVGMGVGWKKQ